MGLQSNKINARLERVTELVVIDFLVNTTADLVDATPVDTGWARANWVPGLGTPSSDPVGTPEAIDSGAQSAGSSAVLSYRFGQLAYIANNTPYIGALNAGHSPQAPAGFVDTIVDQNIQALENRNYD